MKTTLSLAFTSSAWLLVGCAEQPAETEVPAVMEAPAPPAVDRAWTGESVPGLERPPPAAAASADPQLPSVATRMRSAGPVSIVARVRIIDLTAERHSPPPSVEWGADNVTTLVEAAVVDVLCGAPISGTVTFRHQGGKLASGEMMWSSEMPILENGSEVVVALDSRGGNYYLLRANLGVLADGQSSGFVAQTGDPVTEGLVRGWCQ